MTNYVTDAIYNEVATGLPFRLLGLKNRVAVLQPEGEDGYIEVAHEDFQKRFIDSGIHNHEEFCCTVHGTHAEVIHRGCILR